MKKGFCFLFAICLVNGLLAQQSTSSVRGMVTDAGKLPVEAATIALKQMKDSSVVTITLTDQTGSFFLRELPFGEYFLSVSAVNYLPLQVAGFLLSADNPVFSLDTISLKTAPSILGGVTVTAKKPLVEQRVDRMVVNVDASVSNLGATALEVLQKSPGISVDKDGNISLKGKARVLLMMDGKPSYLSGAELAGLLGNMSASQIIQIEIMTNPSAKYDAAGNAGVINIKTKKNQAAGFNGNITLNYGQGVYPKANSNLLLNYQTDKFNAFLQFGNMANEGFMKVDVMRNFVDEAGALQFGLHQLTTNYNNSVNNSLKVGMDYFLSPKTTVGFAASGFISPQQQTGLTTTLLTDNAGAIGSIQKTVRTTDNTWKNGSLNLNFLTSFGKQKNELSANIDYLHYDFAGDQELNGATYNRHEQLQESSYLKNLLPLSIDVYTGKLDFSRVYSGALKFEAGLKAGYVKTSNASLFYTGLANDPRYDNILSNNFSYTEFIQAGYVNLNKKLGSLTLQGGLRLENTRYEGNQQGYSQQPDSIFSRSYLNLFPTAFVGYQINDDNQLALSVGRRIDRPAYQQLNPFTSFMDKYMQMAGNPYLQPQYSNSIELSHSFRNKFITTLNYGIIHQMMNETLVHKDSLIIRSIGNIGTRYNFGISESASLPITRWFTSVIFANIFQNSYDGEVNGFPLRASQWTLQLNLNNQFSFGKGWSAELSGFYSSRNRDEGQALSLPVGQIAVGFSKQLLQNKASIKLNMRDLFYTQKIREIQDFQDVRSSMLRTMDSRVVNIAFVYRFGTQGKVRQGQQSEEQKRIGIN